MVNIARRAVAVATQIGAVCTRILARLLHGALDAQALHILVGGNLRVNIVALKNLRQRHSQEEETDE